MAWIGVGVKVFTKRQGQSFPLDALGLSPEVAFSVRRLRRAYTGPLLRVRRSSDNAEQDFGFQADGWLNTAQLLSFVGSGSGFVTVWYDQNGTNNATMVTPSRQPRIVNNGVLEMCNGRPAVRFIDSSTSSFGHNLEFNRFHDLSTPYVAGATVYQLNTAGDFPYVFGGLNDKGLLALNLQTSRRYRAATIRSVVIVNNSGTTVIQPLGQLISRYTEADRFNLRDFVNNENVITTADSNTDFAGFSNYLIGSVATQCLNDSSIGELIFFDDTPLTGAKRAALQTNQMQAFNITP